MSVPQDGFIALKPIIPSFHYSNIPTFPGNGFSDAEFNPALHPSFDRQGFSPGNYTPRCARIIRPPYSS